MHCFYYETIDSHRVKLDKNESHHLARVMRLSTGDTVWVTDGKGQRYSATVHSADPRESILSVGEVVSGESASPFYEIAIAPPKKPQRFEWFVEKAVELGVHRISPLICERSEKSRWKSDRLHKIAVSAMKQSLRSILPEISDPVAFSDYLATIGSGTAAYIAHQMDGHPMLSEALLTSPRYFVLIGPEGDFTRKEYEAALSAGCTGVNLSPHRLRTETAALAALVNLCDQ